mgnify:CR=1 FL=1
MIQKENTGHSQQEIIPPHDHHGHSHSHREHHHDHKEHKHDHDHHHHDHHHHHHDEEDFNIRAAMIHIIGKNLMMLNFLITHKKVIFCRVLESLLHQ